MKKIIPILIAGLLPAHAWSGPVLDELLHEGMSWEAKDSREWNEGESYHDIRIFENGGLILKAELLNLRRRDESVHAEFQNMDILPDEDGRAHIASGDVILHEEILAMNLKEFEELLNEEVDTASGPEQDCRPYELPFTVSLNNLSAEHDQSSFMIEKINATYDLLDVSVDCNMDLNFKIEGFEIDNKDVGFALHVDEVLFDIFWTMLTGRVPVNTDDPYNAIIKIAGMTLAMNGTEQIRVDEIVSGSRMDPKSLISIVPSGYFDAYNEFLKSEKNGEIFDLAELSISTIWNALRGIKAGGGFQITGAQITGDGIAEMVGGGSLLSAGREFNLGTKFDQDNAKVTFGIEATGKELFRLKTNIAILIDEIDATIDEMGPKGLVFNMPLSLEKYHFSLKDSGLGDIMALEYGVDPYQMIQSILQNMIGEEKANFVALWLSSARNDGAYLSIMPDQPIPFAEIFQSLSRGEMDPDWNISLSK